MKFRCNLTITYCNSQTIWKYDMFPAVGDVPMVFPPHFTGQWRMNVVINHKIEGATKKECFLSHFDMIDSMYAG